MNIRIFQVNNKRDENRVKFVDLDRLDSAHGSFAVDPRIYDEMFRGDVRCGSLEDVFVLFNQGGHPLHRGHSLSVSDVVLVRDSQSDKDGAYYCDKSGFAKIDFDPGLAARQDGLIRVVVLEPGMPAYESELAGDLHAMQRAVGGVIEITSPFGDGVVVISNDSAKIDGMEGNRMIGGELYAGPIIIAGEDETEGDRICASLSDGETAFCLNRFREPESYTQKEVEGSCRIIFTSL